MKDDEKPGTWWQRHRPTNARLAAWAGLITAVAGLISALHGCGPS